MPTQSLCKPPFSFSTTLIVTGLVVGLGIGMVGTASAEEPMPVAHSDGLGAAVSDTVITAKVKAKLMAEKSLKRSKIKVVTTNGAVTLTGSASSSDAKSLAETATKSVEGVKSVDNVLKTPGSSRTVAKTERVVSDSWITTKVKSELLADSVSKGFDVSVTTLHGVVVLKGALASQDAVDHVKAVAARVKGVKSVDTSALTVTGN
ncbi:MAG: BON domain-containing protein [Parasulfuritortus sp.]|nr:BON domain-containing protein [Parasulfuritortus sp.]